MPKLIVICGDVTAALNRRPQLMQQFQQIAQDVTLVCPSHQRQYIEAVEALGFQVHLVENDKQSLNPLTDLGYYRQIKKFLRRERPDDVFVFHVKPILYTAIACRQLGIRCHCLFAGLGYAFSNGRGLKHRLVKFLSTAAMRFALKKCQTVFFQNPDDRQTFEQLGILSSKTHVVVVNGSGVSLEDFPKQPRARDGDQVAFLMVARLLKEKGLYEYFEATRQLQEEYGPKVQARLLGPFDKNPNIMPHETILRWHEEGVIEYLGVTDDVRPYLRDMDVFVLPSYYMEGTPKIILESLATGRPIITCNSRGCRETVEDGTNGFLVEPRDTRQLYRAMKFFLDNPEEIPSMGEASRQMAIRKYDVNQVNRVMLQEMNFLG